MTRNRIAVSNNPSAFKPKYHEGPAWCKEVRSVANLGGYTPTDSMHLRTELKPRTRFVPCRWLWTLLGILILVSILVANRP